MRYALALAFLLLVKASTVPALMLPVVLIWLMNLGWRRLHA